MLTSAMAMIGHTFPGSDKVMTRATSVWPKSRKHGQGVANRAPTISRALELPAKLWQYEHAMQRQVIRV